MFLTPFHKKKESDKKKRIWQKPQKEERIYYASQLKEKQPILVGGIAKGAWGHSRETESRLKAVMGSQPTHPLTPATHFYQPGSIP